MLVILHEVKNLSPGYPQKEFMFDIVNITKRKCFIKIEDQDGADISIPLPACLNG